MTDLQKSCSTNTNLYKSSVNSIKPTTTTDQPTTDSNTPNPPKSILVNNIRKNIAKDIAATGVCSSQYRTINDRVYKNIVKIGSGTYGTVFSAYDIGMEKLVALKRVKLDDENEGIASSALR